jgi:RNA polymerase sigma factor (sigma-70 family)
MANADDDPPLIDDIGIAKLLAKLRAIRDHDPDYGLTRTEWIARAQEIAVRQALRDAKRQRQLRRKEIPIDGMLPNQIPAVPSFVDRLISAMDLRAALGRLSQHQSQVLILSRAMRLRDHQIAAALSLSVRTVKRLRDTAIATLRNSGVSP